MYWIVWYRLCSIDIILNPYNRQISYSSFHMCSFHAVLHLNNGLLLLWQGVDVVQQVLSFVPGLRYRLASWVPSDGISIQKDHPIIQNKGTVNMEHMYRKWKIIPKLREWKRVKIRNASNIQQTCFQIMCCSVFCWTTKASFDSPPSMTKRCKLAPAPGTCDRSSKFCNFSSMSCGQQRDMCRR